MLLDLSHKTALVTGASRGLGRGIALRLAAAGANLIIADLATESCQQAGQALAREIEQLGVRAQVIAIDVSDESSINTAIEQALTLFERIDILVNNAGVMQQKAGLDAEAADFKRCYDINALGPWLLSQALIPHFRGNNSGAIINIASISARQGSEAFAAYCASKAAVISLTQSLAHALGPHGITANAVCPGHIWTEMWEDVETIVGDQAKTEAIEQRRLFEQSLPHIPLRRAQTAEDIGNAVAFLASPLANNITGQALNVSGGVCMN